MATSGGYKPVPDISSHPEHCHSSIKLFPHSRDKKFSPIEQKFCILRKANHSKKSFLQLTLNRMRPLQTRSKRDSAGVLDYTSQEKDRRLPWITTAKLLTDRAETLQRKILSIPRRPRLRSLFTVLPLLHRNPLLRPTLRLVNHQIRSSGILIGRDG